MLHDYHNTRKVIRDARIEYLNRRNQWSKAMVKENNEASKQLHRVSEGIAEQEKMRRIVLARLEDYKKKRSVEKETMQLGTGLTENRMNFFVKKLMQPIRDKVSKRRLNSAQYYNPKLKTKVINTKESKRFHHPASKILLNPETRNHDFIGLTPGIIDPKLMKRQNENPEDFKIKIGSPLTVKIPTYFTTYYAGGPIKHDNELESVTISDVSLYKHTHFLFFRLIMRPSFRSLKEHHWNIRQ